MRDVWVEALAKFLFPPSIISRAIYATFDKKILWLWIHPCLDVITLLKVPPFPPLNSHSLIEIADVGWCVFLIRICTQMIPEPVDIKTICLSSWCLSRLIREKLVDVNTSFMAISKDGRRFAMSVDPFRLLHKFDCDSSGHSLCEEDYISRESSFQSDLGDKMTN